MRMRHLMLLVTLWSAAAISPAASLSAPAPLDSRAQAVFASVKDAVLQIRIVLTGSQSQNSTGSGFYVSSDGLVITNYHVVSGHALQPEAYQIEFAGQNGERGVLKLLAVDVLHDLALLRRENASGLPHLKLRSGLGARGEKLYSLGNPNDLGLVIVEGVNNGLQAHSFYDTIHFTGAINPGMSGGPVVSREAEVAGVNVATMGESRGFLVPAPFAQALLARWQAAPAVPQAGFHDEITRQLRQHSSALVARFTSAPLPVQDDDGFAVPDAVSPYMRCWANKSDNVKLFYDVRSYNCSGRSDVFVDRGVEAGRVNFETTLYRSDQLDAWRFSRLVQSEYASTGDFDTDVKHYGKFACNAQVIRVNASPAKAALCLRAYRKFKGLYDFHLTVASLGQARRAMVSKLKLDGFAYDDGMRLVRAYMGALQWSD